MIEKMEKIKKPLIGLVAGIISGLFASRRWTHITSCIYSYIKNGGQASKRNSNSLHTSDGNNKQYFLLQRKLYKLESRLVMRDRWNCRRNNRSKTFENNSNPICKNSICVFSIICFAKNDILNATKGTGTNVALHKDFLTVQTK